MGVSRVFALCAIAALCLTAVAQANDEWEAVTEFVEEGAEYDTVYSQAPWVNAPAALQPLQPQPYQPQPYTLPIAISPSPVPTNQAPIQDPAVGPAVDTSADVVTDDLTQELTPAADQELVEDPWHADTSLDFALDDPELDAQQVAAMAPMVAASSACANQGGTCKSTSAGCSGGGFVGGLCPGAASIKCCKKAAAPATPCTARQGTCKATNTGCSGQFQSGLCPGAANVKCCITRNTPTPPPTPTSGGCGPYQGAAVQNIKGNGNRNYAVVRIARQHLTNPGTYGANPTTTDNTMLVSTACAFNAMAVAAKAAGVTITINSGFRTLARQQYFWNCYRTKRCNNGNQAASPGTSNHGIGLALDLNASGRGVYTWLRNNGHKFGFVRTVPKENWHWEHRVGWRRAPYT